MSFKNKVIRIDIDETICMTPDDRDYNKAKPIKKNIEKMNKLYDAGAVIIYWTSRGSTTKIDWRSLTKQQLDKWGVRYQKIECNKPYYDLFIDDKVLNIKNIDEIDEEK